MNQILFSNRSLALRPGTEQSRPARLRSLTVFTVALGLLIALCAPGCIRAVGRPSAEELNNVRQIKFALDGFAADHGGAYPSATTGGLLDPDWSGASSSNDYFRQLFLAGETQSEGVFWVRNSKICSKDAPDDLVSQDGIVKGSLVLQAGDCHWAYVTKQTNTSPLDRVLVVEGFLPGTTEWDAKRSDHKVVALRIDGSAKSLRMTRSGDVLDQFGDSILSKSARAWAGSGEDPRKLLVQPEPAP